MKKRKAVLSLLLFLLIAFPAVSQNTASQNKAAQKPADAKTADAKAGPDFFLLPVLETVFSGELRWRPDWPADIPPDGFSVKRQFQLIELYNDDVNLTVRRGREGRLVEFPFFTEDGYAKVQVQYASLNNGALQKMTVSLFQGDDAKIWDITFPADFLPYSDFSPGGSFAPLKVTCDEDIYHVFIFESPAFLTETWYNDEGEMLVFCKASVNIIEKKWRVRSLQIYMGEDISFEDYFFDSYGNVSEVRSEDKTFSALLRDNRPSYWQCPDLSYEFNWDTQGILTIVKASGEADDASVEYRYEYETDASGSWVKRQETALSGSNLIVPMPSLSRGIWNRRITYGD
jgi:hypothetical protein